MLVPKVSVLAKRVDRIHKFFFFFQECTWTDGVSIITSHYWNQEL